MNIEDTEDEKSGSIVSTDMMQISLAYPQTQTSLSDFTIVSHDGQEYKVHKLILALKSESLAAMFKHDCKETRENSMTIPDVNTDVLWAFVRFLYLGKTEIDVDYTCEDMISLACRYV